MGAVTFTPVIMIFIILVKGYLLILNMYMYTVNKRPMGHIAHLSNTGSYENIYTFHFLLPHLTLWSIDFNKLAYVL